MKAGRWPLGFSQISSRRLCGGGSSVGGDGSASAGVRVGVRVGGGGVGGVGGGVGLGIGSVRGGFVASRQRQA